MKAKQILSLILIIVICLSVLIACGKPAETTTSDTEAPSTTEETPPENERLLEKDNLPDNLNYNGETITFFTRNNDDMYTYEIACPELKNDTLFDSIHYRNIDVEKRLGVNIKTISQSCTYSERKAWNTTLSTAVLTNTGDYDATAFYVSTGSPLAKDGIFANLLNYSAEYGAGYLDFSRNWWDQSMVDELSVFGTLFFVGGDLTVSRTGETFALIFNKQLFDEKFPDERSEALYKRVKDGEWTITAMIDYVSEVWEDTNTSGVIDDGDMVGYRAPDQSWISAWPYALGISLTKTNAYGVPELVLTESPNLMSAFELCRTLHSGTPGTLFDKTGSETSFSNGNQLFANFRFKDGVAHRDSEISYGVLPLPKYDAEQEAYRTTFVNTASCLAILSNLDEDRATMVSAVLELLSAESYKQVTPTYYSTVLQGQYSRDQIDAEMFDLILKSIVFEFGYAFSTESLGGIAGVFGDASANYAFQTNIDSKKGIWDQKLEELLEALEAIA